MTVVALLARRPDEGVVLTGLADETPLSTAEAATLYEAMLADTMAAVRNSGGDLLVNYAPGEDDAETEARLRSVAASTLDDPDDIRFEVQVGSTESAVVGNTITHLLETEDAATAAVLRPEAPLVGRALVDSAAMKLRRNDVVLGPAEDGHVYYAGFGDPIDFENALAPPTVETLATRAVDAGLDVALESQHSLVRSAAGLRTVLATLQARRSAGLPLPEATTDVVDQLGLVVEGEGDAPVLRRR